MTGYGSHLYILKEIIRTLKPKKILETGMGFDSTKLFLDNEIDTTSIEMQSSEWYDKVYKEYKENIYFKPYLLLGTSDAIVFINSSKKFDFIFIDGHGYNRWEQINVSFKHTDLIITHDTEAMVYEWENTVLPEGWMWIDFIEVSPWTAVLTNNLEKISSLLTYNHRAYQTIINKDYIDRRRLSR